MQLGCQFCQNWDGRLPSGDSMKRVEKKVSLTSHRYPRHPIPVSYTHLDVYKRQVQSGAQHLLILDCGTKSAAKLSTDKILLIYKNEKENKKG